MKLVSFLLLIFLFVKKVERILCSEEELPNGQTFDFIVVGGGVGGCTLAARLSENGKHSVILIHSGGLPDPRSDIPALQNSLMLEADPSIVKFYATVTQRNAARGNDGIILFPVGSAIGGGSTINTQMINRGSPHDYNNWAKLTGDESWNYKNMLKYFKKFENYTGEFQTDQHGYGGPITVGRSRYYNPGLAEWLQAGIELGYPVADPNSQIISFTPVDFSKKNGRRVSSYKGYIEPLLSRRMASSHSASLHSTLDPNLLILLHSKATKIVFENDKAVGVEFFTNSTTAAPRNGYVICRKEIIITAGTIESTALLLKSGIGPKSVLEKAQISPVKHLPVGENLHDHPTVPVTFVFGSRSSALVEEVDLNDAAWKTYNEIGDGPYSTSGGITGQAFIGTSTLSREDKRLGWANLHLIPSNSNGYPKLGGGVNITDLKDWENIVSWVTFLGRPKSRGMLTLDSKKNPLIDFQYLSHRDDIDDLIEGIRMYIHICEDTKAFQNIGCRLPKDPLPACKHLRFRSNNYWKCYVRQLSNHGFHAAGSIRMGSGKDDKLAVVDTKLKVIGIQNLRVGDASIMPVITNSNLQAAIYAIAEKLSDIILEKWDNSLFGFSKTDGGLHSHLLHLNY